MKGLIIFGILILMPLLGYSQYGGGENDLASRFRPGVMWFDTGFRPAKEGMARKYDRLIFDLTYNDWMGDRSLFKNRWSSIGLNTNWMFDIPLTKGNKVAFGIGLGHQWINIRHDNHLSRISATESTLFEDKGALDSFDKSRYGSHVFAIPIELRFRNEGWRHFKFQIGGKIGFKTQAYSKYSGSGLAGASKYETKTVGYYDISRLTYSAHVRFGLRNLALFGSYSFNPMFTNSESSKLNVLQFGLSISLF